MVSKKKIALIAALCAGVLGIGLYVLKWEHRPLILELYFFHLNRGHSVLIRTPHNKTILIDGGQTSEIIRELTNVFPFYRRRIDEVFVTKADAKNTGGLVDVFKRFEIGDVIEPVLMGTSSARSALDQTIQKKRIKVRTVERGDSISIDNATFSILFPTSGFKYNKTSTPELILRLDYGTTTFAFLGDASKTIQKFVMNDFQTVDILEFANGATKSRVSADFVSKLQPKVIVSSKREETLRYEFR